MSLGGAGVRSGVCLCPEARRDGWRGSSPPPHGRIGGCSTRPCPFPSWEPWSSQPVACAQEFENAEGEEYAANFSVQGSPAVVAPNGPDVYVLPLTEVSLPMAKQPGRSGE